MTINPLPEEYVRLAKAESNPHDPLMTSSFAASEVVKLLVKGGVTLSIHRAILNQLSPSLVKHLDELGPSSCGTLISSVLKDDDASTVQRAIEFAYMGDYTTSSTKCDGQTDWKWPARTGEDEGYKYGFWSIDELARRLPVATPPDANIQAGHMDKLSRHLQQLYGKISFHSFYGPDPDVSSQTQSAPELLDGPESVVFLCHAKLFYWAQTWKINKLAALAIQRLHRALLSFEPNKKTASHLMKLVNFVYAHERHGSLEELGSLREVVANYASCHATQLWGNDEFWRYLGSCPLFARDVLTSRVMIPDRGNVWREDRQCSEYQAGEGLWTGEQQGYDLLEIIPLVNIWGRSCRINGPI